MISTSRPASSSLSEDLSDLNQGGDDYYEEKHGDGDGRGRAHDRTLVVGASYGPDSGNSSISVPSEKVI